MRLSKKEIELIVKILGLHRETGRTDHARLNRVRQKFYRARDWPNGASVDCQPARVSPAPWKIAPRADPERCRARSPRDEQCGLQAWHSGAHTELIESRFLD